MNDMVCKPKSQSKDRVSIEIKFLFCCRDVAPSQTTHKSEERSDLLVDFPNHKMTLSIFSNTKSFPLQFQKTSVLLHQCEAAEHTNLEFRTKRYFVAQNHANTGFVSLYRGQLFIMAVSHGQLSVMGYES